MQTVVVNDYRASGGFMLRTAALVLAAMMLTGFTGCTASAYALHVERQRKQLLSLSIGNQDNGRDNSPNRRA